VRAIAPEIGRHVSIAYRTIKWNRYVDVEIPDLNGHYGTVHSDQKRTGRTASDVRASGQSEECCDLPAQGRPPLVFRPLSNKPRDAPWRRL